MISIDTGRIKNWSKSASEIQRGNKGKGKANSSIPPRTTPFFQRKEQRAALGGIRTHDTLSNSATLHELLFDGRLRCDMVHLCVRWSDGGSFSYSL